MGAHGGIAVKLKCLYCGNAFNTDRRVRKFCSTRCYHLDSRMRREETGLAARKRIMALGAHEEDTVFTVVRKLRQAKAPFRERMVIMDDLMREIASVKSEVRQRYAQIGKKRKDTLIKRFKKFERLARQEWRYV